MYFCFLKEESYVDKTLRELNHLSKQNIFAVRYTNLVLTSTGGNFYCQLRKRNNIVLILIKLLLLLIRESSVG